MPASTETPPRATILRVWRHAEEPARIHYMIIVEGGRPRHLFVDAVSKGGLYVALCELL